MQCCDYRRRKADAILSLVHNPTVTFYGGRDSFWPYYEPYGAFKNFQQVHQVAQEAWSGTTDRAHIVSGFNTNNEDFSRGVIYGVSLRG